MDADPQLAQEKIGQAVQLLKDLNLDVWLTFARETSLTPDPALDMIYPFGVTWPSAFIITRGGERLAVLGRHDATNAETLGAYSHIVGYDASIEPALVEALKDLRPQSVAINRSLSDPSSDGLTSGMLQILEGYFRQAGIPTEAIVSSETLLAKLRGRKTAAELARIQAAIQTTQELFDEIGGQLHVGMTELDVAALFHQAVHQRNLGYAWDPKGNPLVNTGPDSSIGHTLPGDLKLDAGHLVHVDFGVKQAGFCADLQRTWYLLKPGESEVPEPVANAWSAARQALLAGAREMRPGVQGWEVDAAARASLVQAGFAEYQHAFGHHVGRIAHDGGTVLGPRWDRYGQLPYGRLEVDNVFAIELGVQLEGYGPVYLEENVRVTADGVAWLSQPQTDIWCLPTEHA
jgi:Xaa-Pro aminopeptidase